MSSCEMRSFQCDLKLRLGHCCLCNDQWVLGAKFIQDVIITEGNILLVLIELSLGLIFDQSSPRGGMPWLIFNGNFGQGVSTAQMSGRQNGRWSNGYTDRLRCFCCRCRRCCCCCSIGTWFQVSHGSMVSQIAMSRWRQRLSHLLPICCWCWCCCCRFTEAQSRNVDTEPTRQGVVAILFELQLGSSALFQVAQDSHFD